MKHKLFLMFVLLSLSSCTWQSSVLNIGKNTYQVSANASPVRGGVTGAQEMALESANEKCNSLKKQIEVIDIKTQYAFPANGVATIKFTCL